MRSYSFDASLGTIGAGQFGLFARDQAYGAGLDDAAIRRRQRDGWITEVLKDVFLLPGFPPSLEQRVLAHVLWCGRDSSFVSHRCEAELLGLGESRHCPIELTTTRQRRAIPSSVIHRVPVVQPVHRWSIGPIPAIAPAKLALDLGATLPWDAYEATVEEMLLRTLLTLPRARWELATFGGQGVRGTAFLRRFLDDRPPGYKPLKSPLELRVRRELKKAGFPEPLYEYPIRLSDGTVVHPDFSWLPSKSTVEAESYRWHGGRAAFDRDIDRYAAMRRDGWTVIQVTSTILDRRLDTFLADVRTALGS
ncbi:MAG: hypothetical protein ACRDLB_02565 [Actinomycetota bacterium]